MNKVISFVVSVWFWFELFFSSAVLFPFAVILRIITLPFDRNRKAMHWFSCQWSNLVLFLNPLWRVKVYGRDKIDRRTAYVIVSNHQSGADILVLFKLMVHFRWVSKWSLFFFPFIGWNMAMSGYIALKRGRKSSINQMVNKCKEAVREGNSIMIFPEGTRSKDGNVQTFKTGAFRIALETKAPILPIAVRGTSKAIRKGGLTIHKNHGMEIRVLDPLPYALYSEDDQKRLAARVQQIISQQVSSGTGNPVPPAHARQA